LKKARSIPIQRDEKAVERFKSEYGEKYADNEVYFYDESGCQADMSPGYLWAKKGQIPQWRYQGEHIRASVMGAVNPKSGDLQALIMPCSDTESFQIFLDYFNEQINGRPVFLVLDNASWHKNGSLSWGTIMPVYLPPYSPDLNPIEELWKVMKDRFRRAFPPMEYEALCDRIQEVLRQFFSNQQEVRSICKVHY